jgi:hypothetical protein
MLLAAVVAAAAGFAREASAAGPAAVAVQRGAKVEVLDAAGALVRRFAGSSSFSLGGGLLARTGAADRIAVVDVSSGARRVRIPNAFGPVVLPGGRVAFLPDRFGVRDPQGNSVWLRSRTGAIRRLVQFSNGPGLPGITTGLDAAGVLGLSFDAQARRLAVVQGNDVDLFHYDVWVVDVRQGGVFRATTGGRSRLATVSPSGARIAYLREEAHCGGAEPGYRAGDLVLRPTRRTGAPRVLVDGSCAAFVTEPHWLSAAELVAVRLTRTSPGVYTNELVRVDAATGAVTPVPGGSGAFALSVSPGLRLAGFMRLGGGSALARLDSAAPVELPGAAAPKAAGDRTWP